MPTDQGSKSTITEGFEAVYGYPPDTIDLEDAADAGIPDLAVFSTMPENEPRSDSVT